MPVQRIINAEILKNTKSIKKTCKSTAHSKIAPSKKKSPSQKDGRKDRKLKKYCKEEEEEEEEELPGLGAACGTSGKIPKGTAFTATKYTQKVNSIVSCNRYMLIFFLSIKLKKKFKLHKFLHKY